MAALAEDPVVDRERDVSEVGQLLGVRHRLQVASPVDELQLADLVTAAVRVVEEHGRQPGARAFRSREVRRHVLDSVEIEVPRLEQVAVAFLLAPLFSADRPAAGGQFTEQRIELAPAGIGLGRGAVLRLRHVDREW